MLSAFIPNVNNKSEEYQKYIEFLQNGSDLGVWNWNVETGQIYFDERWCEIVGYKRDEIAPELSAVMEMLHPDDVEFLQTSIDRFLKGELDKYEIIFRLKHKSGHWVTILSKGKIFETKNEKPYLFCGTHFDMSFVEKVQTESRRVQKLSNEIQRIAKIGGWDYDVGRKKIILTDEIHQIYEIDKEIELTIEKALEFLVTEDRTRVLTCVQNGILENKSFVTEFRIVTPLDNEKWIRVYGESKKLSDGTIDHVLGTLQDVTYEKKLEIKLREKNSDLNNKKNELKAMIDSTHDGIWDWDIENDKKYMSPRFWKMLGLGAVSENTGFEKLEETIFAEDLPVLFDNFQKHIDTKGAHPFFQEVRYKHVNGSTVWIICRGQVIKWSDDGEPLRVAGAHTDITELKKAHINLQESSKLIALGEMAGGVAHEINNPLAIINSSAEALERVLQKNKIMSPSSEKYISNIKNTVYRISKIVDGLKKISRQGDNEELNSYSVHSIILDSLSLCTEKFKSQGVELSVDLENDYQVVCRPIELSQVIINLLNNAYHSVRKQKNAIVTLKVECNEHVVICVGDNGPGIPEELFDKIMQPFFTTKPVGEGTGLGLSISREIIEKMNGKLTFYNTQPGVNFEIQLQLAENQ